jgi:hypothetical protein
LLSFVLTSWTKQPLLVDPESLAANVRFARILLQKSFWGDERQFLELLIRFTSSYVRDIRGISLWALKSDGAAEKSEDQLSRDLYGCSIFEVCNNIRQ